MREVQVLKYVFRGNVGGTRTSTEGDPEVLVKAEDHEFKVLSNQRIRGGVYLVFSNIKM